MAAPAPAGAVLGIDAGGSSIRARACVDGQLVHDGIGGPGNPLAVERDALTRHYAQALAGCSNPGVVAVCAAGGGSNAGRGILKALLAELLPGAQIHAFADYVAAVMAAPADADAVVIAGTGSIVCSREADGSFGTSGGLGLMLSDHGSAARLGRAYLDAFCLAPDSRRAADLELVVGARSPRDIAATVRTAPAPAALLARAAPLLTGAAEAGAGWAQETLEREMAALANTTLEHLAQRSGTPRPLVVLAGGVWRSDGARETFAMALREVVPKARIERLGPDPADGAVALAAQLAA